ncbi:MAG TPA: hypothetical protein VKY19_09560 [Ktedonosporobacter sp.]|nr:hypothetical protein [Ktedonosporobacter sp.]
MGRPNHPQQGKREAPTLKPPSPLPLPWSRNVASQIHMGGPTRAPTGQARGPHPEAAQPLAPTVVPQRCISPQNPTRTGPIPSDGGGRGKGRGWGMRGPCACPALIARIAP